ncbi:MAG: hypothetical protein HQ481_20450 [Alphaproteobacteria bacterium]|nr:hypothetical protein [Alphaproteobacteria bacterium]
MRRAYLLVAADHHGLTLEDWLLEMSSLHGPTIRESCRPLFDGEALETALVGLPGLTGCLFAVFDYRVSTTPERRRVLRVRGPSLVDLRRGGPVSHAVDRTIDRLTLNLGCVHSLREGW